MHEYRQPVNPSTRQSNVLPMADTIGTDALDHRIEQLRFDTPATADLVHLNNAGASLSPQPVLDAVIDHLRLEARIGGYEAASEAADRVYRAGGALLGCDPSEVAFSISASDAWWRAFSSIRLVAGDRVLCGSSEYVSNAFALLQAKERGVLVELIPDNDRGQIDLEALERSLDHFQRSGSAAAGCRSNRLRLPLLDRPKVPPRTAGHLPALCQRRAARVPGPIAVHRRSIGTVGHTLGVPSRANCQAIRDVRGELRRQDRVQGGD